MSRPFTQNQCLLPSQNKISFSFAFSPPSLKWPDQFIVVYRVGFTFFNSIRLFVSCNILLYSKMTNLQPNSIYFFCKERCFYLASYLQSLYVFFFYIVLSYKLIKRTCQPLYIPYKVKAPVQIM